MAKKAVTIDLEELAQRRAAFVRENPWIIPVGVAIQMIPLALLIHGHVKTNIYRKKLQIEREKTKQLELKLQSDHTHGHHHGHPRHRGHHQHFDPVEPQQL
ncbi:hypothetical protein [Secundilactobacillus folii]|uniref:Transposase n=1 Tax=Secundilactobacillus folii TaxID=2678357 RepID=A0A7X3C2B9_9LACO|nr:hypothetical protein [Secundilactobacillus folii]MTV81406.1 hypothetical protein [Secundilactobacillus folii]